MKTILVDDERLARVNLKRLLEPYPSIEIVGEADSCKSAVELIEALQPHLVFLDIQLTGESGFDLLDKIDRSINIVFVTAFDEYAIRAFEVNAADYLLKPVNPERLKVSIERVLNKESGENSPTKTFDYSDSIYVRLNNYTSKFLKISAITCIRPVGNYSKIITCEGKNFVVLKTMKQWQNELPKKSFIRIHRSTIINIEHIDRVERYTLSQYKVHLKHSTEPLEVSRRYAANLKMME